MTALESQGSPVSPRLQAWLDQQVSEVETPVRLELISGGRSNLTFALTDTAGRRFVLRRPPEGRLRGGAHDVGREYRILSALADSAVPVPRVVAMCDDTDVIGVPFFLMRFVPGRIVTDRADAAALAPEARRRLGCTIAETLARLHDVDLDQVGLSELRRPRGYVERQLRVWGRQLDGVDHPAVADLSAIADRLAARVPAAQRESLVHGDFKLENLVTGADGKVAAVLDWELASVGDRVADLAWLLIWWGEPGDDAPWINPRPTSIGGFSDRRSLEDAYAKASGVDTSALDYYIAFAYWRLSCINLGTRARFLAGEMGDQVLDVSALEQQVGRQTRAAADLSSSTR
jgi:aminoglycoside phosphotransferase (APT) family kinase protein